MTQDLEKPVSAMTTQELEAYLLSKKQAEAAQRQEARDTYEDLREAAVTELMQGAEELHLKLGDFKEKAIGQMETLLEVLREYSQRHQEGKGNLTIKSRDDTQKIVFTNQANGYFDERSTEAEQHIRSFIDAEFQPESPVKELVTKLLERRKGNLDVKLVQKLYSMEDRFDNRSWKEGIRLLKESWRESHTVSYINFYKRDKNGRWFLLTLNISAL